jgi:hypothetical protein
MNNIHKFFLLSGKEIKVNNIYTAWYEIILLLNISESDINKFIQIIKNNTILKCHDLINESINCNPENYNILIYNRSNEEINLINNQFENFNEFDKKIGISILNYLQYTNKIFNFKYTIDNRENIQLFYKNICDNLNLSYFLLKKKMYILKKIDNLLFNYDEFTDDTKLIFDYINHNVKYNFIGLFTCELYYQDHKYIYTYYD